MRTRHSIPGLLTLLAILSVTSISGDSQETRVPVISTTHFSFYSEFQTNLNDALIATGIERKFERREVFQSGSEATCFDEMPPSARAGWNLATEYYQEFISPASFNDRAQYYLRMSLAEHEEQIKSSGLRQFVDVTRGFIDAASASYRACRWTSQDEKNRSWIDAAIPLLAKHEMNVAGQLEGLYKKKWGGLPIAADIVETVSWSGANSIILEPDGGHLLISNSYMGNVALEIIFHEASHLIMSRNDPVWLALDEAANELEVQMPDGLWHVVLFYTTGEIVRRSLNDAGEPPYTPMIYDIYKRSPWGKYQEAIENTWPAYLNGEMGLSEAALNLITAIGKPGE